jgi:hypothetical protein
MAIDRVALGLLRFGFGQMYSSGNYFGATAPRTGQQLIAATLHRRGPGHTQSSIYPAHESLDNLHTRRAKLSPVLVRWRSCASTRLYWRRFGPVEWYS